MTTHLIWFHGWGFDYQCFLPLIDQLPMFNHHVDNQGYFSARTSLQGPENATYIGIGHSLGFANLLQTSLPFSGYISLCGFYQFCATSIFPSGVSSKIVERMITQFQKSPTQVLANFYQQCGITHPIPKTIHKERLEADLYRLLTLYIPFSQFKLIGALSGEDDLITPLSMQKDLFKNLIILKKSGHLPWLKDARNCAHYIQTLVEGSRHNDQTPNPL